ncbi:hypothetical protein FUA23_01045 [Neolewinella aurantiaca]|uniref:Glycosyltransferase RgtA/B/C/D-like domain-containing protein n=1 Tax=Neolewinella aurantiaca TaxID=2602767 RepID=A0A5C7G1J0_9BACT|nr:hypothetical protein [Neolewinella aurantiaca]TXF91802.1 hypothetical protein FUA23_01045 [Neolewinella aurantiaca]
MYLPAAFIYKDLKEVKFLDDIIAEYRPTADPYQVFTHESGNKVMKYSIGQAIMYSPFFAVAHAWASSSDAYPADGFSFPYQFMISLGSLVVSLLGLFWLMTVLRHYFREEMVGLTLLLIVFGTNYLNYSAIDGAMTHNNVFSLGALLLLTSHRFYVRATLSRALLIGLCTGLMALTRPTEIIVAIIPLLWGLDLTQKGAISKRIEFFGSHWGKLLAAAAVTLAIGSIQVIYWKYVSGDWLVYSYQDQGFDWFSPHLNKGFFSYKAGWLIYTPMMIFGLLGFIPLYRRKPALFPALFIHALFFIYVAFSWSVWWYGGSLGQRTMVQEYAVLSFPLAAFLSWVFRARPQVQKPVRWQWWKYAVAAVIALFTWHNLYYTHQAHRGGLYITEQMNNAYFWRTLYKFERDPEDKLRLDTREFFTAVPAKTETLLSDDFEDRSTADCGLDPINGNGSLCLIGKNENSPEFRLEIDLPPRTWLRARVQAKINAPRGNKDNHTQMILTFRRDGVEVKKRIIRMHRLLNHEWRREVQIDSKVPDEGADQLIVRFWNGGSTQPALVLDDLVIERIYE